MSFTFNLILVIVNFILIFILLTQKENYSPMSLLYSDANGNLASSSNIDANSINVIGYGDIKTKMQALTTEVRDMISTAEARIGKNITDQNTNINNKISTHNTTIDKKISDHDISVNKALANCVKKDKRYQIQTGGRPNQICNDRIHPNYAYSCDKVVNGLTVTSLATVGATLNNIRWNDKAAIYNQNTGDHFWFANETDK